MLQAPIFFYSYTVYNIFNICKVGCTAATLNLIVFLPLKICFMLSISNGLKKCLFESYLYDVQIYKIDLPYNIAKIKAEELISYSDGVFYYLIPLQHNNARLIYALQRTQNQYHNYTEIYLAWFNAIQYNPDGNTHNCFGRIEYQDALAPLLNVVSGEFSTLPSNGNNEYASSAFANLYRNMKNFTHVNYNTVRNQAFLNFLKIQEPTTASVNLRGKFLLELEGEGVGESGKDPRF